MSALGSEFKKFNIFNVSFYYYYYLNVVFNLFKAAISSITKMI